MSICNTFAGDYHESQVGFYGVSFPSDSSTLAPNQLYTKRFVHIFSGYPRRFRSFDDGDTTGSFLGPLSIRLSCGWSANHLDGYLNLYPSYPVPWVLSSQFFSSLFTFGTLGREAVCEPAPQMGS